MGVISFINGILGQQPIQQKSVPVTDPFSLADRGGMPKAYIPNFLYRPPFGYPRYINVPNIRRLAAMPYVEMAIRTIIAECQAVPWDIVVNKDDDFSPEEAEAKQDEIKEVKNFFRNPNTDKESFEQLDSKVTRDVLEIDSGVMVKIFNKAGDMVEIVVRDGGLFTKNPDVYGKISNRDDIIFAQMAETYDEREGKLPPGYIGANDMREKAAYFQYGWMASGRPVPFGKREIVWFEQNVRADDIYGRSPVENLMKTIQMLIYAIDNNLEYFTDNSIPKGIIGMEGAAKEELDAFKDTWREQQRKLDEYGNWRKVFWNPPIINSKPTFEKIEWSAAELQLIEQQKWFSKLVWASFGVTPSELGYTEDSNNATEIVQTRVFKRKAINPLLKMKEWKYNHEILVEWREKAKKTAIATHMQETESEYVRSKIDIDRGKETEGKAELKARDSWLELKSRYQSGEMNEYGVAYLKAKEEVDKLAKTARLPFHGIEFKYLMFDVDDETKKWTLYKMQLETKAKTVNDILKQEGENPVDWGDQPADYTQSLNLNGMFGTQNNGQKVGTQNGAKLGPQGSEADSGKKPFADTNKDKQTNQDKRNPAFGAKSTPMGDFQTGNLDESSKPYFEQQIKHYLGMGMSKEEAEQNAWADIRNFNMKSGGQKPEIYSFERFDLKDAKLLSSGGSDRSAYEMPDGKILKIVKSARGLGQNEMEGCIKLVPKLYEKGTDYVLVEKCDREDDMSDNMLAGLQRFSSEDWKIKTKGLLDEIDRLDTEYPDCGFKDVLNYDLIFGDFKKAKNWGWKSRPYLIDAGTLARDELDQAVIAKHQPKWFEIVKKRREAREAGNSVLTKSANLDIIEKNSVHEKAKITMEASELVSEHEKLVKILESGSEEERQKEAAHQKKELEEYRQQAEKKGHLNYDPHNENYDPKNLDDFYTRGVTKKKHPLILDLDEKPTEDKLIGALHFILNENEKKIVELIGQEIRPNKVSEIKSLSDIIAKIKSILMFGGAKDISDRVIMQTFMQGWDKTEKQLERNLNLNREAVDFIKTYTFQNIEGMNKELVEDLRQVLQRGLMEGSGAFQLTEKVKKVFDSSKTRAEMIAITENHRAEEMGRLMAFKESGENYERKWIAHLDDRTCEHCKKMNGQTVSLGENFKDKSTGFESPIANYHPRCRCDSVFIRKNN